MFLSTTLIPIPRLDAVSGVINVRDKDAIVQFNHPDSLVHSLNLGLSELSAYSPTKDERHNFF